MADFKKRARQAERRAELLEQRLFVVEEGYADLEAKLAYDDRGWSKFDSNSNNGFTFDFLSNKATECEIANALNPLIKRGLMMRAAFVWGDGISITVRDEMTSGKDVSEWIKKFLADRSNRHVAEVGGQIALENTLGTAGECYLALVSDTYTGRVQVRPIPMRQVPVVVSDPEDQYTDRYYLRQWVVGTKEYKAFYPALGYYPKSRPATSGEGFDRDLQGIEIRWNQPVKRVIVNEVRGRGLGDAAAALPWAYAYKEFLESWHKIMKSMATFSWLARTRGDKAATAAQSLISKAATGDVIGAAAVVDPNTRLEAINKSGAVFDSNSGQPIAGQVAAALGLPVTLILSDPGITGARAVAETLTEPTKREFQLRQAVWDEALRDILAYVIEIGVRSKNLAGTAKRRDDHMEVILDDPLTATIVINWPELDSVAMRDRVAAIVEAASSYTLPHLTIARELLKALKVPNIDEVMDLITDNAGNFLPPEQLNQTDVTNTGSGASNDGNPNP